MDDNGKMAVGAPSKARPATPSAPPIEARWERVVRAPTTRHIPLQAILVRIGLVVVTYLTGRLLYILRDSILLFIVAGFVALILNPLVAAAQKRARRRGLAVTGGALAGIPTVLFALTRSFTAAAITAAVFIIYQQFENRVLNPVIMSRTVRVNPLLVMVALLISLDIGNWLGQVPFRPECEPRFDFARQPHKLSLASEGAPFETKGQQVVLDGTAGAEQSGRWRPPRLHAFGPPKCGGSCWRPERPRVDRTSTTRLGDGHGPAPGA